ncbi:CRISPR-associated helicase Cas3' [Paratissierella segnis]|uniref:CRISPR-associated helicase Cas3 n=1 Tax=Paratissierella segnis TaxID=2763679 RepID=A0A926IEN2_9FIRM|nr:CRISPR-associated helicase Cas3' [Paratissierella segnis]MBC8587562.1 CRISPR-associated helicase Cas3' [Paratissierella segnis]
MDFFSHREPNMRLVDHLYQVREYSLIYGNIHFSRIHEIVACCHDFGKYTTYFQDRLFEKEKNKLDVGNHSHISAVFTAYVMLERGFGEGRLPLLTYSAVLSHHSRVKNYEKYLPATTIKIEKHEEMYRKLELLTKQKENIKDNFDIVYKEYAELGFGQEFKNFIKDENSISNTLLELRKEDMCKHKDKTLYWIHQQIFSALISADKISASRVKPIEQKFIDFSKLNCIRESKFKDTGNKGITKINHIRNEIFLKVQEGIKKSYTSKLFSITAPTGSGKTMTGFFAALKLKELKPELKKIVYVLPYTSIIDQNYDEIRKLYISDKDFKKNEYGYIMKHHHLSSYEEERSDEIYNAGDYQTFMENWESGVIVTTFVQFLETAVGANNKMLKKFHALKDAVILMDEVQAVDIKYFKLLYYVFKKLSEELNCHIIIMTATKPLFFPDAVELLEDNEKYFNVFNRTKLVCNIDSEMTVKEFADYFSDKIEDKSYMIVVNTISQSLDLYGLLQENFGAFNEYGHKLKYLSTNLIPLHRKQRIEELKEELDNEKIILVSTQVVEAGVDLDFDEVYRDLAPLDSIIQCAGRCNRNNRGFIGNVNVVKMIGDDNRTYGEKIYGFDIIDIVSKILGSYDEIEERTYLQLINEYYQKISIKKSQQVSKEFISSIEGLNFDENYKYEIGKFSLIDETNGYMDVYIEYDEEAEDLLQQYIEAYKIEDINKRMEVTLPIKKKMSSYYISMPKKYWRKIEKFNIVPGYDILRIPLSGMDIYYDSSIGYKRKEDDSAIFY